MGAHSRKDEPRRSPLLVPGAVVGVISLISFAAAFSVSASSTAKALRTAQVRTEAPVTGISAAGTEANGITADTGTVAPTSVAPPPPPPPTPPPPPPSPPTTLPGDPEVAALQKRLIELGYEPGALNGKYNAKIVHAVRAFQKVNDLKRSSKPDPETLTALAHPKVPVPARRHDGLYVEASIPQQYLVVWNGDTVVRILPISTGAGGRWKTPTGEFTFFSRISGKHQSKLGFLWDPVYFDPGGFAVHGEPAVPVYPASHGCIRIPMQDSEWFYDNVPLGTPLFVSPDPLPTRPT